MERRKILTKPPARASGVSRANSRATLTRLSTTTTGRFSRQGSVAPRANLSTNGNRSGAASPAGSIVSMATTASAGLKRKNGDFDPEDDGETTNINVVVRCRGRNEREIKENSAVVVSTEGVKGKVVDLSMGPNALSNKSYHFDRVFSQAADQSSIFDDVVKPILDEMLAGFNCTIFAYGQTGTGKTYTMSGDMTDTLGLLSDAAGIIPRVLHTLFNKLELEDTENSVRCSFIELYNEELRDLLSGEDNTKLKIFEDSSRKGHATTVVQGMEERHIQNATEGLKWLQEGSVRRQVAATKCNDLSSRSHTVFTVTAYVKRQGGNGEDYLSAGKLNLVDLAGSENIQRSGAENKRAAEAGLINKSLLTLGRVINALVDKNSHIPYRESKLTRLLQDSLGGRTKTCIIATISPAKSNLEETISTLDYAFRAKNIRNKPQVNALINKKTLLRELTVEIEKLKSELIATRQRNGVYLTNEAYEEMTVQSESRRILSEEQGAKIETMEANLRNKLQELSSLTSSFVGLKKDHESIKAQHDETKELLDQTELVLAATRKMLAEERHICKAHQETEEKLNAVGGELLSTIRQTVDDVEGLHAKNQRKSDLQDVNRSKWAMSQAQVSRVTELVEDRIVEFRAGQQQHISSVSRRMQSFVQGELEKLSWTQAFVDENLSLFAKSKQELMAKRKQSKEEMDHVLEEIKVVRDHVKQRVGESLQMIAGVAEKIAADVVSELDTFHSQLHASYSSLGRDFKSVLEEMLRQISNQKAESDRLRRELEEASEAMVQSNKHVSTGIQQALNEEKKQAASERQNLLVQMSSLIHSQAEVQESRLANRASLIQQSVSASQKAFEAKVARYSAAMDSWNEKDGELVEGITKSRDALKQKLKDDWTTADEHSSSIQSTTKSVHAEAVRVVDQQMKDLDVQMQDLDDFVTRARSYNAEQHEQHAASLTSFSRTVEKSFENISSHCAATSSRVKALGNEIEAETQELRDTLEPLEHEVAQSLVSLRNDIRSTTLQEYELTGETPAKKEYQYPTILPRTQTHDVLIANMRGSTSPNKTTVFSDFDPFLHARSPSRPTSSSAGDRSASLREVHPNLMDPSASLVSISVIGEDSTLPIVKRSARTTRYTKKASVGPSGRLTGTFEGLENIPLGIWGQSVGPGGGPRRKSPRLQ